MNLITLKEFEAKYEIPLVVIYWYLKNYCKIKPVRIIGRSYLFDEQRLVECLEKEFHKRSYKRRNWIPSGGKYGKNKKRQFGQLVLR